MNYINVKNPAYADQSGLIIDCVIVLDDDSEIPFAAASDDCTDYGVEIYNKCVNGDYGAVSEYIPPVAIVPNVVTMRQARLALLANGLLADIETEIANMAEPDKSAVTIEWEYSQTVERDRPFVTTLGSLLGLSDAELDDLFVLAATL